MKRRSIRSHPGTARRPGRGVAMIAAALLLTACGPAGSGAPTHGPSGSLFAGHASRPAADHRLTPALRQEDDGAVVATADVPSGSRRAAAPSSAEGMDAMPAGAARSRGLERPNVVTDFSPEISAPRLDSTVFLDPLASVIGAVEIGRHVYVAPFASLRGDEGQPIHVGDDSNVQDGVVVHALETIVDGAARLENTVEVHGAHYAVYIGNRVSLAHQSQVHGPAWIEDDVFVGMKSLVFRAHIGRGAVVEPTANVIGVTVPPGRYVRAGTTVSDQAVADALPLITDDYAFRNLNAAVVHVNTRLAAAYAARNRPPVTSAGPAAPHPR